ncbi:hypothetical protein [Pseudomonas sp. 14P_5.3_Bac1]|jgi:hypothetical protein|uniref:hypothetical protein n=1 Tax=Pseudomonas sp. 14P_5.3_Bac1 TaxID=2971622 RepID=UPI0021C670B5|nr:hypothetical protein [Pseudomonas sp. 14P_5.3_Bac1]MCU1778732.1 hypothetical protein [Pseudomonas sp. 14P_5.3_Bac1]
MSVGMRIWGANGALQLDENSFTVRIVHSQIVQAAAGKGRFIDLAIPGYPDVNPTTYSAVCVPVAPYEVSGQRTPITYTPIIYPGPPGYVRVYFGAPGGAAGSPIGTTPQRLLVMRYK